ncbi:MAG TPA: hypothetical protein VLN49_12710, partial [Gemmatimonadaceae bacterium]|nr:hypothetical protein [Gemmatimonadaceae bacterium]
MKRIALLLLSLLPGIAAGQGPAATNHDIVVTGGWLFASTGNDRVQNPGLLIRAGKILSVGG